MATGDKKKVRRTFVAYGKEDGKPVSFIHAIDHLMAIRGGKYLARDPKKPVPVEEEQTEKEDPGAEGSAEQVDGVELNKTASGVAAPTPGGGANPPPEGKNVVDGTGKTLGGHGESKAKPAIQR
jgi:hypothetical protein